MNAPLYDAIGIDYARLRRPDPRIAARIDTALGRARTVVNVGAGAGSYEPAHRDVTAVEPSREMIAQRSADAAPAVRAGAEALPFDDDAFDAAMAVLTVHHWSDRAAGLREMARVARGPVVVLSVDPAHGGFWLYDYFPGLAALDAATMPGTEVFGAVLKRCRIETVPVPHDCVDGFLAAWWRRPAAYLDERVRRATSPFHLIDGVEEGVARLERDLKTGRWHRRYGGLLTMEALDCGYRLIVARG